jgi:PAP2 superfamily
MKMGTKRIAALVVTAALALVATMALGPAASSSAPIATSENAVVYWSGIAEDAIAAGRPPASSAVMAGIVHGAVYDAVAATKGGLKPFATRVTAPPDASPDAAIAQAARDVLVNRIPAQAAAVDATYNTFMAGIPDGPGKEGGKAVGAASAAGMLAMRLGDGWNANVAYVQPTPGPGVFEPIAAGVVGSAPTAKPVGTELPFVRPLTFERQSKYRPGPAYKSLQSKRYAKDVAEVQLYGKSDSAVRTAEQAQTVRFHTDQTYAQFSRGVRRLAHDRGLGLRESARLLGYIWVATGDTMIACWEAKYHYMLWRPNHAIQRADTDGNGATVQDPTWLPLITGNHPEYPSGHGCFTGSVTTSLKQYFGTRKVTLTLDSAAAGAGGPRTYTNLDDLVEEVWGARIWGGLHYRTTMEETSEHFPRIARDVGRKHFLSRGSRDD